jgi:hypothetical protein
LDLPIFFKKEERKSPPMGSRKQQRKPKVAGRGIADLSALRANMQEQLRQSTTAPPTIPSCLSKLDSSNPAEREEGCLDMQHIALVPAHHTALAHHKAHRKLAQLLLDPNVHLKAASAAALRNFLTSGADELLDEVVAQDALAMSIGMNLQQLVSEYPTVTAALAECEAAESTAEPKVLAEDEEEPETSRHEQLTTMMQGIELALEETLHLAGVAAEGNEAASQVLSSSEFLQLLVTVVCNLSHSQREGSVSAAVAAGECLSLLSTDSDQVARFIAQELSAEQFEALNGWIRGGPGAVEGTPLVISPRLLRLSLSLASTLMHCAPSAENVARVLPVLCHAFTTLPLKEWTRTLPLLSEDCNVAEDVRTLAISQSADRFRAVQAAVDLLSSILDFACEQHEDEQDDEAAFSQNPYAHTLASCGAFARLGEVIQDLLQPFPDAIAVRALREATPNGEASTLQHLFLSVEVGIFGVASSLLMMLPVTSLAPFPSVWRATVIALEQRYQLMTADAESLSIATESPSARSMLLLQMESLSEMAWTIQRKDHHHESQPQPADLDVFTRLAWCAGASNESKIFSIGAVGSIGMRYRHESAEAMTACARFCNAMFCETKNDVDVRAEAANSLMDLFNEESFDATLYVPLQLQHTLHQFLVNDLTPLFQASRRSGNKAQYHAMSEIAENLKQFLQYKKVHCSGL